MADCYPTASAAVLPATFVAFRHRPDGGPGVAPSQVMVHRWLPPDAATGRAGLLRRGVDDFGRRHPLAPYLPDAGDLVVRVNEVRGNGPTGVVSYFVVSFFTNEVRGNGRAWAGVGGRGRSW